MSSPSDSGAVLVAGATGTTGGLVAARLRDAGVAVRGLTRSEEHAEALRRNGIDAVVADTGDPSSLRAAFDGVRAAYVASPSSPEMPEHEGNFARAAAQAGVGLLVKLSVIGASPDAPIMFGRLHAAAEERVRDAGVPHAFLRPNGFMQNTLMWTEQLHAGAVYGPVTDARWSIVDARDIADVAALVLQDPRAHTGAEVTITGPEPLSPREEIAILSEIVGRDIEARDVTVEQAMESMRGAGMPDWYAERLGELFRFYETGAAAVVRDDAPALLGRPMRTYRQFAEDHHHAFALAPA